MYSQQLVGSGRSVQPVTFSQPIDIGAGYVTPPQGRLFFVCGDGTTVTNLDDSYSALSTNMERLRFASVALALAECKASRGDVIFVHPSHTENLATADSWPFVAGVRIIGIGQGNTRPTFTFSAAASTLLLDVAAISIQNCRFLCAGPAGTTALTVAAPFNITGEGCSFIGNYFQTGIDVDQLCTIPFTVSAANCLFYGNRMEAAAVAGVSTTIIRMGTASTGADGLKVIGNSIKAPTGGTAIGVIDSINSTATSAGIEIRDNYLENWLASSTAAISLDGNMVTTGEISNNRFRVQGDSIQPVVYSGTGVDISLFQNYCNDTANGNGALVVGAGTST